MERAVLCSDVGREGGLESERGRESARGREFSLLAVSHAVAR